MIERKGNYIDGTRIQMDYDEVLKMVQVAYSDKKHKISELLAESWPTDTYETEWYHQHTRGKMIAQLSKEFERIAVILHHLQQLGEHHRILREHSESEYSLTREMREPTFDWWFNKGDEEE